MTRARPAHTADRFDRAVRLGKRSPTTAQAYRYRFERHVRDGIGAWLVRNAFAITFGDRWPGGETY